MKKLFLLIFCLLISLLFPQILQTSAQTPQPQNLSQPGSSYTPHPLGTCSEPLPFGNTAPEPYCQPGYTPNDTFPYIVPCKDVTDRNTCRILDGAAIGNGFDWHNVDSINYKSGNYVIQTSNQKSLLYEVRGNEIFFIQDTTWSNSTQCSNGKPAFQRINGRSGMLWAPKSLSCAANNSYSSQGTNAGFEYFESQEESLRLLPDNVTPCSAPHIGDVSGRKHLIFNGNAKCGSFSGDILVIRNMEGAGTGEVFIYCKGVGLCGWYQNINFSDPKNNPRNWVGKDICAGTAFGHDYGACYVGCHPDGINKPVPLSVSQSLQAIVAQGIFGINLLTLQPADGDHKIAIKPQKHLNNTTEAMLPNMYKIHKKEQDKPSIQNGEKIITLNQDNADITVRSNIKVGGSEIAPNAENNGAIPQGDEQVSTSEDSLWNTKDCKDCREQDDYNKLLGSISSKNKTTMNTPEGVDLTKRANRLADHIRVPDQQSTAMKTDTVSASPENQNVFVPPDGGTNIILGIALGLADLIGKVAEGLGVTVPTTVTSCTRISNDDDLYQNTRTATYAFFPHKKIDEFERIPKAGEQDNPYTNPVAGSGDSTIRIAQAYYPTNFVNTTLDAQKCSVLSRWSRKYQEECSQLEPDGTSDWSLGLTQTPVNLENTAIDQIIVEEAMRVGIPACVLRGVGIIEGAYGWNPNDETRIRECRRNECSAAGPFQFTTGSPCGNCPPGYCPNAWAQYGNGGNPCEPRAAANAAARKLKNDGPLTNADPTTQLTQILNAGYRYYGSRRPVNRLKDSFGNACSYGQYVYLQCSPSFNCAQSPR